MNQHLSSCAIDLEVNQHVFIDLVMIEQVVRIYLIGPFGAAGVGVSGEDRCTPEIVATPLICIPRAGIRGAVIKKVQLRIVGNPPPDRAASDLPPVGRPRFYPEVLTSEVFIKRLEVVAD